MSDDENGKEAAVPGVQTTLPLDHWTMARVQASLDRVLKENEELRANVKELEAAVKDLKELTADYLAWTATLPELKRELEAFLQERRDAKVAAAPEVPVELSEVERMETFLNARMPPRAALPTVLEEPVKDVPVVGWVYRVRELTYDWRNDKKGPRALLVLSCSSDGMVRVCHAPKPPEPGKSEEESQVERQGTNNSITLKNFQAKYAPMGFHLPPDVDQKMYLKGIQDRLRKEWDTWRAQQ